jgi:hypothetical protein
MRARPADDHGHMEQGLPSPHTHQPPHSSDLLDVLDLLDLSRAYAKLGVRSRSQLPGRLSIRS